MPTPHSRKEVMREEFAKAWHLYAHDFGRNMGLLMTTNWWLSKVDEAYARGREDEAASCKETYRKAVEGIVKRYEKGINLDKI